MTGIGEHLQESRRAIADVFRNRSLRRLNLALIGSVIGDWAYAVAVSVYVYQRNGAAAVGLLGAVRYVSNAVLSPLVAITADRFDRRRVMIVADVVRAALVMAAALIVLADGPSLPVYALFVLTGWVGLAFRPAQSALLPHLAGNPSELTAANVTASTIHSVGFFAGPAVAGVLLAVAEVGTAFVFDAATFAWSAILVYKLHVPAPEPSTLEADDEQEAEPTDGPGDGDTPTRRLFAGVGDGYREIFHNRDLRLLVALYVTQTIVAGASVVYEVAIAFDLLDLSQSGLSLLYLPLGVGGIVGGFLALLLAQRGKLARDFGLGVVLWGLPLLLVAIWPHLASALVAMALIGLGNSVVDVNAETIVQRLVPDEVMGRVFGALDSAAIAGMAIGAALMPLLISSIGVRSGLAVIAVFVTVVVVLAIRGLHRIDRVALAPEGIDALLGVAMLSVLPEYTVERLARQSSQSTVPAGSTVFEEGDAGDRFYVIESGTADVIIGGRTVASIGVGDSFGEIALLRDVPRTATIRATSDLGLRSIDRRHFLPAVTGHTEASEQAELHVTKLLNAI